MMNACVFSSHQHAHRQGVRPIMKKYTAAILILVLALAAMACSLQKAEPEAPDENVDTSSERVTQEREVTPFTSIQLNGGGEVQLLQGSECALTIEAPQDVLNHLTSEVKDGKLVVGYEPGLFLKLSTARIVYTITFEELEGLEINGGAMVRGTALDLADLSVKLSGGADFKLEEITLDALNVVLDGGGNFVASGSATTQAVTVNGAANYNTEDLESQDVKVVMNGAGSVRVWAQNTLNLKLIGAYSVSYYGNPAITQDVSGLGQITNLGDK